MKNNQQGCGCSSQVLVAFLGLMGVILTGFFGLAGAIISREDIPLPFISNIFQRDSGNPAASPSPIATVASSATSTEGNPVTIVAPPAGSGMVRSRMILDGYTIDSTTGSTAAYRIEINAEGVGGSNYSTFSGISTATTQDSSGQIYSRQATIEGEFNSGVLSLYDTGVVSEDFLPSGGYWCYISIYAPAADPQGSSFYGTYESFEPPCYGQVTLQVVSQTPLP